MKSLPTRERGLKCPMRCTPRAGTGVAPHAGAWIEIKKHCRILSPAAVAPHAGAWIEI